MSQAFLLLALCFVVVFAAGPGYFTLLYRTNWQRAYLHYTADCSAWIFEPGDLMYCPLNSSFDCNNWREITVGGTSVTFVLTDGAGNWDNNHAINYHVYASGRYKLDNGNLTTLETYSCTCSWFTTPNSCRYNNCGLNCSWCGHEHSGLCLDTNITTCCDKEYSPWVPPSTCNRDVSTCCAAPMDFTHSICCGKDTDCCAGKTCCPKGTSCCPGSKFTMCCPDGFQCCPHTLNGTCCPNNLKCSPTGCA